MLYLVVCISLNAKLQLNDNPLRKMKGDDNNGCSVCLAECITTYYHHFLFINLRQR